MKCVITEWLEIVANVASIITAFVAAWFWFYYRNNRRKKQRQIENYLEREKAAGKDKGQRTVLNITKALGFTEDEVKQLSFSSKHIIRRVSTDEATGFAKDLLLEYSEDEVSN